MSQFSNDGGSKDTESFIDRLHEKAGKKEEKKKQGSQNSYGGEIDTWEGAEQHHPIHPRFVYASCIWSLFSQTIDLNMTWLVVLIQKSLQGDAIAATTANSRDWWQKDKD